LGQANRVGGRLGGDGEPSGEVVAARGGTDVRCERRLAIAAGDHKGRPYVRVRTGRRELVDDDAVHRIRQDAPLVPHESPCGSQLDVTDVHAPEQVSPAFRSERHEIGVRSPRSRDP
jgi:hypothetical protein